MAFDGRTRLLDRLFLWASEKPRLQRFATDSRLTRRVVDRFVAGEHLDDAISAIRRLNSRSVGGILDLLGEGVTDPQGADAAANEYAESVKRIQQDGVDTTVTVKLTQLGLAFDKGACIDHLRVIVAEAQAIGTTVEIDMEQSEYVTATLDIYRLLRSDFDNLRVAIQAYLRRTPGDLEGLADLRPKVRLVKGAYAEPPAVAFQRRKEIDRQYAFLTQWLFERGDDPGIATHDGQLLEHAKDCARRSGLGQEGFEIQMLYGIRRDLQESLAAEGFRVRCYVPFGVAWYPYLMRRLAERPANVRFFLRALVRN